MPDSYEKQFEILTGNKPFPWQALALPNYEIRRRSHFLFNLKTKQELVWKIQQN